MAKKKFLGNMDFSSKLNETMSTREDPEEIEPVIEEKSNEIEEGSRVVVEKTTAPVKKPARSTTKPQKADVVETKSNEVSKKEGRAVANPAFALPKQAVRERKSVHKNILITQTDYDNLTAEAEELGTTFNNLLHLIFEQRYSK